MLNHPWLLENHAEELAELEFCTPMPTACAAPCWKRSHDHEAVDTHALRAAIDKRNLGAVLVRVEAALSHGADWPARAGAAPDDVRPMVDITS